MSAMSRLWARGPTGPGGPGPIPTNPFVAKSLGLKVADSFEHEAASGLQDTWTVKEVKPRWLQALNYLSKDFGRRFPDAHGFFSIPIAEGDIEPVLEQVRRHGEASTRKANLYLVHDLPIALAAGDRPGGGIAFADYLASIGEDLRVCYGTGDERSEALTLIGQNRPIRGGSRRGYRVVRCRTWRVPHSQGAAWASGHSE